MTYRFQTNSSGHLLNTAGNKRLIEEMIKDAINEGISDVLNGNGADHGFVAHGAGSPGNICVGIVALGRAGGDYAKAIQIQAEMDAEAAERRSFNVEGYQQSMNAAFEPAENEEDLPHTNGMAEFYAQKRKAS